MPGTTNGEHRKLIGVKTMSLLGYGMQFLLSGVLQVFQNWNYNLQKRLSDVLPNQQSHQELYRTTCYVGCGNLSDFPLQYCTLIALVFEKGAVAKPSGGFLLQYRPLIA